jgi:hypothetical protein
MQVFALRNSHKKKSQLAAENAKREAEKEKYKKNNYGMSYEDWDEDDKIKKENSCGLDLMDMEMDSFKVEHEEETRRAGKSKYSEAEKEYFTPVNAKVNAPADGDYWGKDYGERYIVKEDINEDAQQGVEKKKGGFANIDSEKWAKIGSQVAFGMLSTGE